MQLKCVFSAISPHQKMFQSKTDSTRQLWNISAMPLDRDRFEHVKLWIALVMTLGQVYLDALNCVRVKIDSWTGPIKRQGGKR